MDQSQPKVDEVKSSETPTRMHLVEGQSMTDLDVDLIKRKKISDIKLVGIILSLLVVVLGVGYSWRSLASNKVLVDVSQSLERQFSFSAQAQYVVGDVWQVKNGRKVEIIEGDVLVEQDKVVTGVGARVVLELDDGSIIRVDENSEVVLESMSPDLIEVREDVGRIFARVNKDENHLFLVKADDVTVTSLGTAFSVENEEEVSVNVFEHSVKVKNNKGEVQVDENKVWKEEKTEDIKEEDVVKDEFLAWNLKADSLNKVVKEEKVDEAKVEEQKVVEKVEDKVVSQPVVTSSISLSAAAYAEGVIFEWGVKGLDTPYGFKIVKGKESNPTFPENESVYVADSGLRRYDWGVGDGGVLNFRVCQYLGDGRCGVYSNNVSLQTYGSGKKKEEEKKEEKKSKEYQSKVSKISLSVEKEGEHKAKAKWSVEGNADKGVKVVWSKNSNPEYPAKDGDKAMYVDSGNDAYLWDLDGGTKYYVRVCEYTGDGCGTYSNQVDVQM